MSLLPCTFTFPSPPHQITYTLCPLFSSSSSSSAQIKLSYNEDTPPTHTEYVYQISLRESLRIDGTLPQDLQCAEDTWACMTVINTRPAHPSEPPRILQVVPLANGKGLAPKTKLISPSGSPGTGKANETLQLTLHGGRYMDQKQKIVFRFICSEAHNTKPELQWRFNGTHVFHWESIHGCPERVLAPPQEGLPGKGGGGGGDSGGSGEEDGEEPPEDPEYDDGDNDEGGEEATLGVSLAWISGFLFLAVLFLQIRKLNLTHSISTCLQRLLPWRNRLEEGYSTLEDEVPLSPMIFGKWANEEGRDEVAEHSGGVGERKGYGSVS